MTAPIQLTSRIALVTGAGGGLGKSHSFELARRGASVVVNDLSIDSARAVAEEIQASGGNAVAMAGSVTDEAFVKAMVEETVDRWGRVDILVNNAGILRDKSFAKMSLEDFRLVVDVHLMGAAICTKAVWELMRANRYGRIVMTTSSSGLYGNFGQANYGAAKMALVGLMQTLAIEGEKYGIRVNCLAPTAATQMTDGVLSEVALRSLAPEAVSPGIAYLVSENAPNKTVLCAGAGHFAAANVTLTGGKTLGRAADAADRLANEWASVVERNSEIVPQYGFQQCERELEGIGSKVGTVVMGR